MATEIFTSDDMDGGGTSEPSCRSSKRSSRRSLKDGLNDHWEALGLPVSFRQLRRTYLRATLVKDDDLAELVEEGDIKSWSRSRLCCARVLGTLWYNLIVASVIVFNCILLIIDTDLRQGGMNKPGLAWFGIGQWYMIGLYTCDFFARMYVHRCHYFVNFSNVVDCSVLALDYLMLVLPTSTSQVLTVMRVARILRIVRLLRVFAPLRELYLMLQGLVAAVRAILFAIVLIICLLTVISIVAVETLHKDNYEMWAGSGDCDLCEVAFSSVMMSSLTFFKTIIAGDSWGLLAVPLIRSRPLIASFVLVGASCIVQLGLLNLIVAIIVDRAREARASDHELQHALKEEERQDSFRRLRKLFEHMDEDKSGSLDMEELLESYDKHESFRALLRLMDITRSDLKLVFEILDSDNSGAVTYTEFIDNLHRMRNFDSHTLLVLIRHHCEWIRSKMELPEDETSNAAKSEDEFAGDESLQLTKETAHVSCSVLPETSCVPPDSRPPDNCVFAETSVSHWTPCPKGEVLIHATCDSTNGTSADAVAQAKSAQVEPYICGHPCGRDDPRSNGYNNGHLSGAHSSGYSEFPVSAWTAKLNHERQDESNHSAQREASLQQGDFRSKVKTQVAEEGSPIVSKGRW